MLAVGRHVTGMVTGEAARTLEDAGGADVIGPRVADLVAHLTALADDPARTDVGEGGRPWVRRHADLPSVARRYVRLLGQLVPDYRRHA